MSETEGREFVTVTVEGELATVTLVRPDRLNAQTPRTWRELSSIGAALPGTVRVVLLRGLGRSFSAGLDKAMFTPGGISGELNLADLAGQSPDESDRQLSSYQASFGWLARPDLISVAAVQGHAIGAGFQLALACDLRLVADDAQLAMAEVPLGLIPDLGGTRRLVELVGYARALEIVLTGRRIGAVEAAAIGLANRVVGADDLAAAAEFTVRALLSAPRNAVIEAKALLLGAANRDQAAQESAERLAQHRLMRELAGFADG